MVTAHPAIAGKQLIALGDGNGVNPENGSGRVMTFEEYLSENYL
jgi:hypothetical protein